LAWRTLKIYPVLMTRYDAGIDLQGNPLLSKITMVGITMGEGGHMSRANLKKTMDDLTRVGANR
jgi:hypothetical protein